MLRAIASVIVGYIVMFAFVFVSFTAAYLALGADGSFKPGTYDVSTMWIAVSSVLSLIAAILGGWIAVLIARSATPPKVLAGLVLVLGLLMAIPAFLSSGQPAPPARTADVGNLDAMMKARTPPVLALITPLIGAAGVMLGASLCGRRAAN